MVEEIKVGSIIEDVIKTPIVEPVIEEPIVVTQVDVVTEIIPSEWKVLNTVEKQTFVASLVNDNLDVLIAEKEKDETLQKIIADEIASYKALDEEYRLKRIALEKQFAELKVGV
jgi:hypothetical protein